MGRQLRTLPYPSHWTEANHIIILFVSCILFHYYLAIFVCMTGHDTKRRDNCLIMVCIDPKIGIHFKSDLQFNA